MNGGSSTKEEEWYCRVEGLLEGPFTERELKCKYVEREIGRDTEVWVAREQAWKRFAELPFYADIPTLEPPEAYHTNAFDSSFTQSELLFMSVVLAIAATAVALFLLMEPARIAWDQRLFIVYVAAFNAFWFVYFMSRQGPTLFHVHTLRRLLRVTALQWIQDSHFRQAELEKSYQEKARSSVTATAMFAAIAGLELTQVNLLLARPEQSLWASAMLGLAGLAALTALICFILSVDALDVMFNKFASHTVAHKLYRHYYMSTINPRYFGLLSLITAAVLLIAHASAAQGSAAIGLIVAIGFRHWFPPPNILEDAKEAPRDVREPRSIRELCGFVAPLALRLIVFVGPPVMLYFHYQL